MRIVDWILTLTPFEFFLLICTGLAPIAAVQLEKWLERRREGRRAKVQIFKTLMATRATPVSPDHVRALNEIDLEFYGGGKGEASVRTAWTEYRDHLNKFPRRDPKTGLADQAEYVQWVKTGEDRLIELLSKMARCLGYAFDRTTLRNSFYFPQAHAALQQQDADLRALAKEALQVIVATAQRVSPAEAVGGSMLPPPGKP
jgi:hypothetical protein